MRASEGIPFIALTDYSVEKLYELKGEIVGRGVKAVTGFEMPTFPKRRFQHGRCAVGTDSAGFPETIPNTGNNSWGFIKQAGLIDDWPTVKAKFIAVNKRVPGYVAGVPGDNRCPEQFSFNAAEMLRAWCLAFADELVDPTIEQPAQIAATWGWW